MRLLPAVALIATVAGCGTTTPGVVVPPRDTNIESAAPAPPNTTSSSAASTSAAPPPSTPPPAPPPLPQPGNPAGKAAVPPEAQAEDTSKPTKVIGDGTPDSCTSQAVLTAVAAGGVITFSCGPTPITITLTDTAKVKATTVLDGGGRVILSGGEKHRIITMNAPSASLTLQNLTLTDGSSTGDDGGGAVYVRGGKVKVVNSRFLHNHCDTNGPDLGGAALRVNQATKSPIYVVNSTFDGGTCANGGALSGLHVSFTVLNSVMTHNNATGRGANPARSGTPGGGSGGAIYTDGDQYTVKIAGTIIEDNHANEGGGAIFYVSNNRAGAMTIDSSSLRRNKSDGFETIPGIFYLGTTEKPQITGSTVS